MLPEMFKAYAVITGHEVTHANRQPTWKITTCKRAFGKAYSGYHVVVQHHQVPWAYPKYEHGARHAISPMLDVDGDCVYINVDTNKLSKGYPSAKNKLSDWGSKNIKHVEKWLRSQRCTIAVDGQELVTPLKPMPFANEPMMETGSLYCLQNESYKTCRKSIDFLDSFLKRVIRLNGRCVLEKKDFGMDCVFQSSVPITEHLKLFAEHCNLDYKYFGRTGSAPQTIFAAEWIIRHLEANGSCARAEAILNNSVANLLKEEDHVNRSICKRHYVAHKSDTLKPFAELDNETHRHIDVREDYRSMTAQRLASGKFRPSMQEMKPSGFVEPRAAVGSLKDRCNDIHNLTIKEQDAQDSFIAMVERRNQLILQLARNSDIASNEAFRLLKHEVEEEMKEAQRLWDAKHSNGICTSVTNAGKRVLETIGLSPSKKRRVGDA